MNLSEALVKKILIEREERILLTVMTDTGMATAKDKYKNNNRVDILYFPLDEKSHKRYIGKNKVKNSYSY